MFFLDIQVVCKVWLLSWVFVLLGNIRLYFLYYEFFKIWIIVWLKNYFFNSLVKIEYQFDVKFVLKSGGFLVIFLKCDFEDQV